MIISCLHIDTTGPNGYSLRPKAIDGESLTYIGEMNDRHYYAGNLSLDVQATDIDAQEETRTDEIEALIKQSNVVKMHKQQLRRDIEQEGLGDLADLLADQAKIIEMLYVMTARITADYLGGTPIQENHKPVYLARAEAVINAIDSGAITLRADFDDMDKILQDVMSKQSRVNQLVRDNYVTKVSEIS